MAVGVIDRLEVVDIQNHHCKIPPRSGGAICHAFQMGQGVAAVEQPGQLVGDSGLQPAAHGVAQPVLLVFVLQQGVDPVGNFARVRGCGHNIIGPQIKHHRRHIVCAFGKAHQQGCVPCFGSAAQLRDQFVDLRLVQAQRGFGRIGGVDHEHVWKRVQVKTGQQLLRRDAVAAAPLARHQLGAIHLRRVRAGRDDRDFAGRHEGLLRLGKAERAFCIVAQAQFRLCVLGAQQAAYPRLQDIIAQRFGQQIIRARLKCGDTGLRRVELTGRDDRDMAGRRVGFHTAEKGECRSFAIGGVANDQVRQSAIQRRARLFQRGAKAHFVPARNKVHP